MAAASVVLALALAEPGSRRWSDLRTRVVSGLVLGPVALLCLWLGGTAYVLLMAAFGLGVMLEWVRITGTRFADPSAVAVVSGVLLAMAATVDAHPLLGLGVLALTALAAYALARSVGRSGIIAVGVPYVGCAAVALLWLRTDPAAGRADILFLVITVWAGDIGAYTVGRMLGGPKLAPRISPGKTWSGAAGGLLVACLCGLGVAWLLAAPAPVPVFHVLAVAICLSIVAQAGDLLESLMKRYFGVKDSGRTIPGHGGLLDRLDGLLAAAPVAALLALALGRGVMLWQ